MMSERNISNNASTAIEPLRRRLRIGVFILAAILFSGLLWISQIRDGSRFEFWRMNDIGRLRLLSERLASERLEAERSGSPVAAIRPAGEALLFALERAHGTMRDSLPELLRQPAARAAGSELIARSGAQLGAMRRAFESSCDSTLNASDRLAAVHDLVAGQRGFGATVDEYLQIATVARDERVAHESIGMWWIGAGLMALLLIALKAVYEPGLASLAKRTPGPIDAQPEQQVAAQGSLAALVNASPVPIAAPSADQLSEKIESLTAQVPGVIFHFLMKSDGSIGFPFASAGLKSVYGLSPADVRGDANHLFQLIDDADIERFASSIQQSALGLTYWSCEHRNNRPDGETRWVLATAMPRREDDGAVHWHGFATDITESKRLQFQLESALERLELAAGAAGIGVWEFEPATGRLSWDERNHRVFGTNPADFKGNLEDWRRCIHPEDLGLADRELARCLRERVPLEMIFRIVQSGGHVRYIQARAKLSNASDWSKLRMVGTHCDVTIHKEAEQAFLEAGRAAEAANQAKSEFLANMSHEIRTPLAAIMGFTDMLMEDGDMKKAPKSRVDAIDTIRNASDHLLTVLNDILDLSKIEAGRMTVEDIDVPFAELITEIVTLMKPRATSKGLAIRLRLDSEIPDRITADPTRLRQILMNLLGNAIKFTDQGGVTLSIGTRAADAGQRHLTIDVTDSGAGMSPDQAARLFEAFEQADTSVTRKHGGTGLGLMISRRLANLMGGDVSLEHTQPGVGTCFRVTLPLRPAAGARYIRDAAELERPRGVPTRAAPIAPGTLRGKILLAEDGLDNQRLIGHHLRKAGAAVEIADNGRIALDMLDRAAAAGQPFDLLITDMQMPEMDGYTLASTLRARASTLPILAITAHAMPEDREKCLTAGCDDYATKPIARDELIAKATHCIRKTACDRSRFVGPGDSADGSGQKAA